MTKYTLAQFQKEFPDDEACLDRLMAINFGGTEIVCPACGVQSKFHRMTKRRSFACQECGHHVYPCANTIFHKSSTKLTIWFTAMYLMTSTRHGVAAKEVQRQTGVTYKCAWRMCHELRKLMKSADHGGRLGGHVEIDESYFGPKQTRDDKKMHGQNKEILFGMTERNQGKMKVQSVPNAWMTTIEPIVKKNVKIGSVVSTDEHGGYNDLHLMGLNHGTVKHSKGQYVRGAHHTNTIEGYWGHLKRSIRGTHVSVSNKHLWKYAAEFSYRRNFRSSHSGMFNRLVAAFALPTLKES